MMFKTLTPKAQSRPAPAPDAKSRSASAHTAASLLPRYLQRKASEGGTGASTYSLPRYLQAKLEISQPGDAYEQQANRVAEQVMRMPAPVVQRQCAACAGAAPCPACAAEQESIQRKAEGPSDTRASPDGRSALSGLGGGQSLDRATRAFFEPRLGFDLSQVRVHSDSTAGQSARDLNARAYTVGQDVVFGPGKFAPSTQAGQQLLAHELVHVMQQSGGPSTGIVGSPSMIQREMDKDPKDLDDEQLKREYDSYNEYIHSLEPEQYAQEEGNMHYFNALEKEVRARCLKDKPSQPDAVSQTLIDRITGKYETVDGDPGEGMIPTPYVAAEGQCTIGYGHVIFPKSACTIETTTNDKGNTQQQCNCAPPWNAISKAQAIKLLEQDIKTHVNEVRKKIKVDLSQGEFDAMVDLSAHVGSLPQSFVDYVHTHWCTDKAAVRSAYLQTAIKMKDPNTKKMKVMKNFVDRRKRRAW